MKFSRQFLQISYIFPAYQLKNLKARIHCEIYLSDYFMKHNLTYISLHLIWFHEIRIKYVKRKPPRTISPCLPCLHVVAICWPVWHKVIRTGNCFFIILPEIKTDSFTIEFKWSCARNKFRTGTFCRIFKYLTEHLKVPGNL